MLPESPVPLPLLGVQLSEGPSNQGAFESHLSHLMPPVSAPCSMFKTQLNKFGLVHVFRSDIGLPSHDPDEQSTNMQTYLSQLPFTTNSSIPAITSAPNNPFHPYPNKSSLWLGDWYWNHRPQKSHKNFKLLLDIIGDLEYNLDDVQNTNWKAINKELGSGSDDGQEASTGWSHSPITISVPFHCQMPNPGPCDYTVPDFHHRCLVSIICDKLSDPFHHCIYHYEPYELRWHPPNKAHDVRVHGELYVSDTFIKAQEQLLASPREPDCDLPRCIAALMFWSDATQLTLFGSAKLWPLYLYFGNQSKYMRCEPSSNLCSHVAYFQSVSYLLWVQLLTITVVRIASSHIQGFCDGAVRCKAEWCPPNSLLQRVFPCAVAYPSGWQVPGSIWTWHCDNLPGPSQALHISSNIHLFLVF